MEGKIDHPPEHIDQDYDGESDEEEMEDESMQEEQEQLDGEVEEKIRGLIEQINADPYDFVKYQQLIEIYRNQNMIEELREARNQVHEYYCLPVDMWVEWLEDEEKILEMHQAEDPEEGND